jgi:hypothetical protein
MRRSPTIAICASHIVPSVKARACAILAEFNKAQTALVGKAVILTDGKAGTPDLDERRFRPSRTEAFKAAIIGPASTS